MSATGESISTLIRILENLYETLIGSSHLVSVKGNPSLNLQSSLKRLMRAQISRTQEKQVLLNSKKFLMRFDSQGYPRDWGCLPGSLFPHGNCPHHSEEKAYWNELKNMKQGSY